MAVEAENAAKPGGDTGSHLECGVLRPEGIAGADRNRAGAEFAGDAGERHVAIGDVDSAFGGVYAAALGSRKHDTDEKHGDPGACHRPEQGPPKAVIRG